jgi:outer membrane protein OmpA-like peptidoglycan-associated protein
MLRVSALIVSALMLLATASGAGAQSIPNDEFSTNRFFPAPGPGNYIQVDGAAVGGHVAPSVRVLVDYAHRPFVLFDASCAGGDLDECEVEDSETKIIAYQLTTNIMGTLTLWQRLQLGLTIPLVRISGDSFAQSSPTLPPPGYVAIRGGRAFGPGDPRLSAKVRLVGSGGDGFTLAANAFMSAPLGQVTSEGSNLGDDTVTGGGHFVLEYRTGPLSLAANAGGVVRPERELLSTAMGPEFTYGVGSAFEVTSLVRVIGEFTGVTQFSSELDENPIEARVAGELAVSDITFLLGGGVGLLAGVGVPDFRVFGGAGYAPAGLDTDGDGINDKVDKCPAEPEDEDGYLDDDGCPDLDNDADGMDDERDRCPNEPEDPDGFEDEDGCPDRDNDGDGVQDGYDSCPDEPEDKDGDRDDDGCPDNDRDRDGVGDDVDKCPDQPEDTDGLADDDGCPETDADGDGIADDEDYCPDEAGSAEKNGCPGEEAAAAPPPPPKVVVTCEKVTFPGKVYFKTGSSKLETRSHQLLRDIAEALANAKHVKKVEIQGHTDDKGSEAGNLKLSQARAESVLSFMTGQAGMKASRLTAKGYGESKPIESNKTATGREANRRVEFVVTERDASCDK